MEMSLVMTKSSNIVKKYQMAKTSFGVIDSLQLELSDGETTHQYESLTFESEDYNGEHS